MLIKRSFTSNGSNQQLRDVFRPTNAVMTTLFDNYFTVFMQTIDYQIVINYLIWQFNIISYVAAMLLLNIGAMFLVLFAIRNIGLGSFNIYKRVQKNRYQGVFFYKISCPPSSQMGADGPTAIVSEEIAIVSFALDLTFTALYCSNPIFMLYLRLLKLFWHLTPGGRYEQ